MSDFYDCTTAAEEAEERFVAFCDVVARLHSKYPTITIDEAFAIAEALAK